MHVIEQRTASDVQFSATRQLNVLDHFRTPYCVSGANPANGCEWLRSSNGGAALLWPSAAGEHGPPAAAALGEAAIPIFASVVPDTVAQALLDDHGETWARAAVVSDLSGEPLGSVWRCDDGSVFLPFDPDEVRLNLLSERYTEILRGPDRHDWRRMAMHGYYRIRGFLPKPVQIWLRRRYAPIQARTRFPRWPVETGLHDFLDFFFSLLQTIAGEPVPRIAAWPDGRSWALVLTHDVETAKGVAAMQPVLDVERALGLRSSWNFVPKRYEVSVDRVRSLLAAGFEVGVHGLYHDGRDLESPEMLRSRLPGMREAAARWDAIGFRSPATHRGWELMPMLGFDYDTSYPDTDPFEPQGGGCCTWLPFFNGGMVELPLTMPQDHGLFVILRHQDEHCWTEKAEFLRSRGGMALIDTHPDYLVDTKIFSAYTSLLERFSNDETVWKALPREVSGWWRRRAESTLERVGREWRVTGSAAEEARIEFVAADTDWQKTLRDGQLRLA